MKPPLSCWNLSKMRSIALNQKTQQAIEEAAGRQRLVQDVFKGVFFPLFFDYHVEQVACLSILYLSLLSFGYRMS